MANTRRLRQQLATYRRPQDLAVLAIVAAAMAIRWVLWLRAPALLTNDSPAYLSAAERLARSADFSGLGDWRLPGYPLALAFLWRLHCWDSRSLVLVQSILGVATVGLAMALASRFLSRRGTLVVGGLLAVHPVYLVLEHAVMPEALLILLLWAFAVAVPTRRWGPVAGFGIGVLLVACIMTRSNGLLFCGLLIGTSLGLGVDAARRAGSWRPVASFALAVTAVVALLVGSWTYRNLVTVGIATPLSANFERAELLFYGQSGILDPTLPGMSGRSWDSAHPNESAYALMFSLARYPHPEDIAGRLVAEQRAAHPRRYLRQIARAFLHSVGVPTISGENDALQFWVALVTDLTRLQASNVSLGNGEPGWYRVGGRDGRSLRLWRWAGLGYLTRGREVLGLAFLATSCALLAFTAGRGTWRAQAIPLAVAAGVLGCLLAQALTLADYDRYAAPFEGFELFVIVAAVESALAGWGQHRDRTAPQMGSRHRRLPAGPRRPWERGKRQMPLRDPPVVRRDDTSP